MWLTLLRLVAGSVLGERSITRYSEGATGEFMFRLAASVSVTSSFNQYKRYPKDANERDSRMGCRARVVTAEGYDCC